MKSSVVGTAAAAAVPSIPLISAEVPRGEDGQETVADLRLSIALNEGWSFKRQASPGSAVEALFVGAERVDYDDSQWTEVWLPHTWDATADNPFATSNHFRGVGWYRKKLDVPAAWRGRRIWIHFKGVFQVADVWVNGGHLGRHVGGYTGFAFDMTDQLEFGRPNLLAVKVDDVLNPFIAPAQETNVANYGGIYRTAMLEVMNPLHVRRKGTWVSVEGDEKAPIVRVRTWMVNQGDALRAARLQNNIVDREGKVVAKLETRFEIKPGEEKAFDQKSEAIPDPRLWSPSSPYLYRVETSIQEGSAAVDRTTTRIGLRFMRHEASRGFTLNGEAVQLHGVNRRQDYGFLGDAVPQATGVRDVRLMKEMGVNFFRTSHYPQDPAVLDACDELGILVWEEVPNIKIHVYHPSEDGTEPIYTTRFPRPLMDNIKAQLQEMIESDRNHPSIIIWGFADDLSRYQYPEDFVELSDAAHALDPTRWTAGRAPHVTDIMDATTYDDLWNEHEKHPERMYIWNEWGAFACERGREGQALIHDHELRALADSEMAQLQEGYLMQWNAMRWLGTAKWCMFDCGEVNGTVTRTLWEFRDERVTLRWPFNDYLGVSDMWRLPKNAYFFFQSQWTDAPMVHIVGHWTWAGEEGRARRVRVYSNCDSVELILNGQSLGTHSPASQEQVWGGFQAVLEKYKNVRNLGDQFTHRLFPGAHLVHPPFVWDSVNYQSGTLVATGKKGNVSVRHELRTAGAATAVILKPEKETLLADGSDVVSIVANVVDAAGATVPTARPWIKFSLQGPGRLLGGTTEIDAISGLAAINVQSTGQAGQILVEAASRGLQSGSARLEAVRNRTGRGSRNT